MIGKMVSVEELVSSISEQYHVLGTMERYVRSVYPIDKSDDDSLCFCRIKDEQALEVIGNSRARVIICSDKLHFRETSYRDKTLIQVSNPRLTFSRLLARYFPRTPQPRIHPTAIIDEKNKIGQRVFIGPYCHIGDCEIGNDTIIESHVYIHTGTMIGKGVIIHPGVVIGDEAFSFERNENGELEFFPQIGNVAIKDNVEIGANSRIVRGPLPRSDTTIDEGTKLSSMVLVGHGVKIGKHCLVAANTVILGHVKIGDFTQLSSLVCIKEGVNIGSRALVGMGSVVLNDIPDDQVFVGSPARLLRKNVL